MQKGDVVQMTEEEIARIRERKAKSQARAAQPRRAVNNDLARAMRAGDQSARSKLIEQNVKLVYKIAQKYRGEEAELISEGLKGLCVAADDFDPDRGIAFSTHAAWRVKAYIMRYILDNHSQVKIGGKCCERILFFRLPREESKLVNQGLPATSEAVAAAVGQGMTASDVDAMRARMATAACASLDAGNVSEEGQGKALIERLSNGDDNPEDIIASKETEDKVLKLMVEFEQSLSQNDLVVWNKCVASDDSYGGATHAAVATGLCKQRVSQIKADLVNRFVRYAKRNGLGK